MNAAATAAAASAGLACPLRASSAARQQGKRTKRKDAALRNVVLDRHADHLAAPWQSGRKGQEPGHEQQRQRGGEEGADHPPSLRGSMELGKQEWNKQQFDESVQAIEALAPADVGPAHAQRGQSHEDQRASASRAEGDAAHRGRFERRQQRDEPDDHEDAGGRGRPGQRKRDGTRQPVRRAGEPCAIKTIEPGTCCGKRLDHVLPAPIARCGGIRPILMSSINRARPWLATGNASQPRLCFLPSPESSAGRARPAGLNVHPLVRASQSPGAHRGRSEMSEWSGRVGAAFAGVNPKSRWQAWLQPRSVESRS